MDDTHTHTHTHTHLYLEGSFEPRCKEATKGCNKSSKDGEGEGVDYCWVEMEVETKLRRIGDWEGRTSAL